MDCSCVDSGAEGVSPGFWREKAVKSARKTHECGECHRIILAGEPYNCVPGVWGDGFATHKVCIDCQSIINMFFCGGYVFGEVQYDLQEHIDAVEGELPESKMVGLTPRALGRVCQLIDDHWDF
jgi:hypothetical protein